MTTRIRTGLKIPEVDEVDEDGFGIAEFDDNEAGVLVNAGYATYIDTEDPPPSTRQSRERLPKEST